MNDFFEKKGGWVSQIYDSEGRHIGTRQLFYKDKAHLVITNYDSKDFLKSIEHVFPIHEGGGLPYEFMMQVTKKLSEANNSEILDPELGGKPKLWLPNET